VLSVNNRKKFHCASLITAGENGETEVYRQLLNNFVCAYIANNVSCLLESVLVFRVHMAVFSDLLSCVNIQHYEVYNILSKAARLFDTDITLLL